MIKFIDLKAQQTEILTKVEGRIKKVLNQIQDGTFNKEWLSEYEKSGKDAFDKYMKQLDSHQIEQVGKQMRKMMWPDSTE